MRRVEDPALLRGEATYVDDLAIPGVLRAAFVRSPYAHAEIRSVDVRDAAAMPGVERVFTGADIGLGPFEAGFGFNPRCAHPPLAVEKARYVGDPVAMVVAETLEQALDAAEAVEVDYGPLPAVVDPEAALAPGAPLLFEELGDNVAGGLRSPEGPDPLAGSDVVVRGRFVNQRVAVMPMEGEAIAAVPHAPGDAQVLTVFLGTQMPHAFKNSLCRLLELTPESVRVVAPWVGGGFGGKVGGAAELMAVVLAARILDRPVKWAQQRSENLVGMHGRGQVQYVEMGFSRTGEIVGLRTRIVADSGAYAGINGLIALSPTYTLAQGVYNIPQIRYDAVAALTNTSKVGAFRGAGRPEAAAFLERVMDMAAGELDIDPVELRRKNFIRPDQFPFRTLTGALYDSGDYERTLDKAVELAGVEALRREQAERRERGDRLQIGIGFASYVEITNGGAGGDYGSVEVHTDGTATIRVGTSAHGQGHATSFSMIVADRLGIPIESIRFVQSDTNEVPTGGGTGGSRSLQSGGVAVAEAAALVLERARELASDRLEADPADVVVNDEGRVGIAGVPERSFSWGELAAVAVEAGDALVAIANSQVPGATYPFGTHVSVVEVDMETGYVRPLRHVAVDDAGTVLNPLIFAGQQHGGIAQGMAQALWEEVLYDGEGNPITGNLASYCMPSAAELCFFEADHTETPTSYNPLGAKGIGEAATIGATPAVQNAVIDALAPLGVRHLDLPCTPERVWMAIEDARRGTLPDAWREPPPVFSDLPVRGAATNEEDAEIDL